MKDDRAYNRRAMKTLADRIRYIRAVAFNPAIDQTKLADLLGVKRGAVGNWELGGNISRKNAVALSNLVPGCTLEWLLQGIGPPPKPKNAAPEPATPADRAEAIFAATAGALQALGLTQDQVPGILRRLRAISEVPLHDARDIADELRTRRSLALLEIQRLLNPKDQEDA